MVAALIEVIILVSEVDLRLGVEARVEQILSDRADRQASRGKIVVWDRVAVVRVLELHCPGSPGADPRGVESSTGLGAELSKVAGAFAGGQKLGGSCASVHKTLSLVIREEKQFVFNYWAADDATKHVIAQLCLGDRAICGMTQSTLSRFE